MFCRNCGQKLSDDAKWCLSCGVKLRPSAEAAPVILPDNTSEAVNNRKGKLALFIALALLLLTLILSAGAFYVFYWNSAVNRINRQLKTGNLSEAFVIYQEKLLNDAEIKEIYPLLKDIATELQQKLTENKITYEDAKASFKTLQKFKINQLDEEIAVDVLDLEDWKKSNEAFTKAEAYLSKADYAQALSSYQSVRAKDANFAKAKEQMAICKEKLRKQYLSELDQSIAAKKFDDTLAIAANLMTLLPDDTELQKNIEEKMASADKEITQISLTKAVELAKEKKFDEAIQLLDDRIKQAIDPEALKNKLAEIVQQQSKAKLDNILLEAQKLASQGNYPDALKLLKDEASFANLEEVQNATKQHTEEYIKVISSLVREKIGKRNFDEAVNQVREAQRHLPTDGRLNELFEEIEKAKTAPRTDFVPSDIKQNPIPLLVTVNGSLNIRKGPGMIYDVITSIPDRAVISLLSYGSEFSENDGTWYYVEYNSYRGWSKSSLNGQTFLRPN